MSEAKLPHELAVRTRGSTDGDKMYFDLSGRFQCGDISDGFAIRTNARRGGFVANADDLLALAHAIIDEMKARELLAKARGEQP